MVFIDLYRTYNRIPGEIFKWTLIKKGYSDIETFRYV